MGGTGRTLLSLSLTSSTTTRFSFSFLSSPNRVSLLKPLFPQQPPRVFLGFRPLCSTAAATADGAVQPMKHSLLLERLRIRHLKDSAAVPQPKSLPSLLNDGSKSKKEIKRMASSFEELGLTEEVVGALIEMDIKVPTEIQSVGVPAVLEGKSLVLGSHTGSGKTLAYMLPLVQVCSIFNVLNLQLLRNDETFVA